MQKNMVNYKGLYFIRNDLWPHPLHFYFPLLFLFVSHYQDSFPKTHNHMCSCSYRPDILTAVISLATKCSHMDKCVVWLYFVMLELIIFCVCVFWMRTWLNLCKMMPFLCIVFAEKRTSWNVCESRWNVLKVLRDFLFWELYEWFGKLGHV